MKKLLNVLLTGMLLTVLSFGTAIVADATNENTIDISGYTIFITASENPMVFTGAPIEPQIVVKDSNDSILEASNYDVKYENNINAGENVGSVIVTGKGSYSGTVSKTFSISKANDVVDLIETKDLVYNGNDQQLISIKQESVGLFSFILNGTAVSYDKITGIDAGDYTISYTFSGDDNHAAITSPVTINTNIKKCPATVSITGEKYSVTYDGTEKVVSATNTTYPYYKNENVICKVNGDSNSALATELKNSIVCNKTSKSFGTDACDTSFFGLSSSDFSYSSNFDVQMTVVDGSFKINKAILASVAAPTVTSFTYNGYYNPSYRPRIKINANDDYLSDSEAASKGFSYYYLSEEGGDESTSSRMYTNAKNGYIVYFRVVHKNYDYVYEYKDGKWGKWEFDIKPKKLTSSDFTWSTTSFTYDGSSHTPVATVKESSRKKIDVGENNKEVGTDTVGVKTSSGQTNAGTYTATVTGLDTNNYELSGPVSTNYTITQKSVTFNWPSSYSGSGSISPLNVLGIVNGDDCSVNLSTPALASSSTTSKTYNSTATLTGTKSGNYKITSQASKTYQVSVTQTPTQTTVKQITPNANANNSNLNKVNNSNSTAKTNNSNNKTESDSNKSGSSGSSSTGSSSSSLGSSSSSDLLTSNNESALDMGPSTSTLESGSSSGVSEGTLDEEALADGWLEAEEDDVYYDSHAVDSDMYDAAPDMSYARAAHLASPESTGTILGLVFGIAVCCMIAGIIFVILHFRKAKSQL